MEMHSFSWNIISYLYTIKAQRSNTRFVSYGILDSKFKILIKYQLPNNKYYGQFRDLTLFQWRTKRNIHWFISQFERKHQYELWYQTNGIEWNTVSICWLNSVLKSRRKKFWKVQRSLNLVAWDFSIPMLLSFRQLRLNCSFAPISFTWQSPSDIRLNFSFVAIIMLKSQLMAIETQT